MQMVDIKLAADPLLAVDKHEEEKEEGTCVQIGFGR
jgi:hypothetical protein